MSEHDPAHVSEEATVRRRSGDAVEARPDTCDAHSPFGKITCTEPKGHIGDHQYHEHGARATWSN